MHLFVRKGGASQKRLGNTALDLLQYARAVAVLRNSILADEKNKNDC